MSEKDKNKKNTKFHLSKLIIPFVILSIFVFTGIAVYTQITTSIELSPTLITCFYAFCTGELWMLSSIKKTKINHNNYSNTDNYLSGFEEIKHEVGDVVGAVRNNIKESVEDMFSGLGDDEYHG